MSLFDWSRSFSAARAMCASRGWTISNLALQKSLYVADMVHTGRYSTPLIPEEFEAWDYGPVLPSVYGRAKIFGSDPVKDVFPEAPPLPPLEQQTVTEISNFLQQFTAGQLVDMTHWNEGAWASAYRAGIMHIPISKQAEADEYLKRAARTTAQ